MCLEGSVFLECLTRHKKVAKSLIYREFPLLYRGKTELRFMADICKPHILIILYLLNHVLNSHSTCDTQKEKVSMFE